MIATDASDWLIVRRAYEDGRETVGAICRKFGISLGQLYRRRTRECWKLRCPRGVARPGKAPPNVGLETISQVLGADLAPAPHVDPEPRKDPGLYVKRLYELVDHQINLIERRRREIARTRDAVASSETERVARMLSILVRAVDKLVELEGNLASAARANKDGQTSQNADQFRNELARRIQRIKRSRPDKVFEPSDVPAT